MVPLVCPNCGAWVEGTEEGVERHAQFHDGLQLLLNAIVHDLNPEAWNDLQRRRASL